MIAWDEWFFRFCFRFFFMDTVGYLKELELTDEGIDKGCIPPPEIFT